MEKNYNKANKKLSDWKRPSFCFSLYIWLADSAVLCIGPCLSHNNIQQSILEFFPENKIRSLIGAHGAQFYLVELPLSTLTFAGQRSTLTTPPPTVACFS